MSIELAKVPAPIRRKAAQHLESIRGTPMRRRGQRPAGRRRLADLSPRYSPRSPITSSASSWVPGQAGS